MADDIRVFAPASVGNACVGFDVLGFAVDHPGDEIRLIKSDEPGIRISRITGDEGKLSHSPSENTASIAIQAFLEKYDRPVGVEMELNKKMPFGSGLGSSAASAVAGAFAVNQLFDCPFQLGDVLEFAMEGEFYASGAHHADNVAPCLYGGFKLIRNIQPFDIIDIPVPHDLYVVLIYPEVEIKTSQARSLLPYDIPLKTASKQWANVAGLVSGLISSDYGLISRSMVDYVAEPYRSKMIPGFNDIKTIAMESGALGLSISGSGPTMFAFCRGLNVAETCGKEMVAYYEQMGIGNQLFISTISRTGPIILA